MGKYFETVNSNYSSFLDTTISEEDEIRKVFEFAQYATGESMDPSSVVRVSRNEFSDGIVATYAIKRMDNKYFIMTLSTHDYSLQSVILDSAPSHTSFDEKWGDIENFI